jgi:hypothetical protein
MALVNTVMNLRSVIPVVLYKSRGKVMCTSNTVVFDVHIPLPRDGDEPFVSIKYRKFLD